MIKVLLSILIMSNVYSSEAKYFRIGEILFAFSEVEGVVVNQSCENKKCMAFTQARKFVNSSVPSSLLKGGKNPFTVKCKEILKGTVIIAQDMKRDEQSLCAFSDGSYLLPL